MQRSDDRILTTHVGSLARSDELLALIAKREGGEKINESEFNELAFRDTVQAVRKQANSGVDIGGNGEIPRVGFSIYAKDRLGGFSGHSNRGTVTDFAKFPDYAALVAKRAGVTAEDVSKSATLWPSPQCVSAVSYNDGQVIQELDMFEKALEEVNPDFRETFITAVTPGILSTSLFRDEKNPDYVTDEAYVYALAEELRKEYELIVSRGHVLQLDAPDLALERQIMFLDRPIGEFMSRMELHVDALNRALVNIPPEKVRLHLCWGNWEGPHIDDIDLEVLLPLLYKANVGGLSWASANPRHSHETELFRKYAPPKDYLLFPGCIDVTYHYLEHPEVVANRILDVVSIVGDRERVVASTDCGFSTFAGYVMVANDVAWAKLEALSEGAKIASEKLWGN